MTAPRTSLFKSLKLLTVAIIASLVFTGCGGDPSFSLTSINEKVNQDKQNTQISKIDVLWVIDNSISMFGAQKNLATNFKSFINNFSEKNLDFQLGVASTDSYRNNPLYSEIVKPQNARLRDGSWSTGRSGVYVVNPDTPNLNKTFITNVTLGTGGFGDERAFSSIEAFFKEDFNNRFLRPDSFLAIIIVSDEDDFSYDGIGQWEKIRGDKPELYPVSSFVDFLDKKTGLIDGHRRYNVSSIHIKSGDKACLKSLQTVDQKYGKRYEELVEQTNGSVISLCSDFSKSLGQLSEDIILASLHDTFRIKRRPIVTSIQVKVNGKLVPKSINGSEGWAYLNPEAGQYLVRFTKNSIPPSGARVDITFDPYEFE